MKKEPKAAKSKTSKPTAPKASALRPNAGQSGKELRKRAEEIAREMAEQSPEDFDKMSPAEIRQTLHELRVHQIQLDMQNEELRQIQAELDASRVRYFDLYDLAPVGYVTISEKGLILETNFAAAKMLGVPKGKLMGQVFSRFVLKEDQDIYYRLRKQLFNASSSSSLRPVSLRPSSVQAVQASESQAYELRMLKKDGSLFWGYLEAAIATGEDGTAVFRVVISNISERKQLESQREAALDALQESEEKFRRITENMSDFVTEMDAQGIVKYLSPSNEKVFGKNVYDLVGQSSFDHIHPEDLDRVLATYMEAISTKSDREVEYRIRHEDGHYVWIRSTGHTIFDDAGKIVGNIINSQDITEHKKMEDKLKESEERFRQLADSTWEGILIHRGGVILDANESILKMFGWRAEEAIGKSVLEYLAPESIEPALQKLKESIDTPQLYFEGSGIKKDKTVFPIELSGNPIKYRNLDARVIAIRDLTHRKQAEKALRESELYHRTIFENSPLGMTHVNHDGVVINCNEAFAILVGAPRDKIIGFNVISQATDPELREAMRKGIYGQRVEYENIYTSLVGGKTNAWRVIINPVNLGQSPTDVISTHEDVTERMRIQDDLFSAQLHLEEKVSERTLELAKINETLMTEVMERIKSVEALKESQALFETALTSMTDAMFISDAAGQFVNFNDAFATFHRFSSKADCKKTLTEYPDILDVFLPNGELAPLEMWAVPRALRGEMVTNAEYTLRRKDTGETWIGSYSFSPLRDNDGLIVGSVVVARDITESKKLLESLQESQELFRRTLDLGVVGMATTHPDTYYFLSANKHLCEMIGYTEEELLKKTWAEITFPKGKVDEDTANVLKLLSGEWNGYVMEKQYQHKDGHMIDITLSVQAVRKKDGTIDYILTLIDDITERKRAEKELVQHREHLEEIVAERTMELQQMTERMILAAQAGGVGVWDYDTVNNILTWDDQMFTLYGIIPDQFSGAYEAWQAGLHPEDRQRGDEEIRLALSGEKEFNTEFRVVWPDGTIRYIRALAIVQRDAAGLPQHMIGTNWDITESKNLHEQLDYSKKAAESANRAKSAFVANMSHEIRTPMNAIMGFAQVLERDPSLTPQQADHIRTIHRSTEHLLRLINDILDISKIEAGHTSLNESVFSLHGLLEDMELMFTARTSGKGLQLLVERDDSVPRCVTADEGKLRQVLVNLLGNAVKFTVTGGIAVRIRAKAVEEKIRKDEEYLRLEVEVEDTGVGIPREEMERIFDPFHQGDAGVIAGGTGLGLDICRRVVEMMGGKITVTSQVGKGSCFRFSVLMKPAEDVAQQEKRARRRIIGLVPGTEPFRILAVDDMPDNRALLCALLKPLGFEVAEATNGVEALSVFERWSPHAVLMDMRMPIMDGYEATRRIKATKAGKTTPIIATTASAFEDAKEKVMDTGVCAYVRKPFRMEELCEELGKCLDLRYIYADEATAAPDHLKAVPLTEEAMAALPAEMITAMRQAVAEGNMTHLTELIAQVEKLDSPTASGLQALADRYDYEKLSKWLEKGEMNNG